MWFKTHKWTIIIPLLVLAVLAAAFWYGGSAPDSRGWTVSTSPTPVQAAASPAEEVSPTPVPDSAVAVPPFPTSLPTSVPSAIPPPTLAQSTGPAPTLPPTSTPEPTAVPTAAQTPTPTEAPSPTPEPSPTATARPQAGIYQYSTDAVPDGKPLPVEPQDVVISETAYTCTVSISCATVLDNMDLCDPEKAELVPEGGWILSPTAVTFYDGESVFNVLQRTCKQLGIHLEFSSTPVYNSVYIEAIHNLYEFDVGSLSGWMYKVNDWFPNYSSSRYQLKDGDVICWVYSCDLGSDVGGGYAVGG